MTSRLTHKVGMDIAGILFLGVFGVFAIGSLGIAVACIVLATGPDKLMSIPLLLDAVLSAVMFCVVKRHASDA